MMTEKMITLNNGVEIPQLALGTWIVDDNGLDGKLSSGRESEGSVYFEVPEDAESVELEYDINLWQSDKIIFVGK